jgi:hypothetical protein
MWFAAIEVFSDYAAHQLLRPDLVHLRQQNELIEIVVIDTGDDLPTPHQASSLA